MSLNFDIAFLSIFSSLAPVQINFPVEKIKKVTGSQSEIVFEDLPVNDPKVRRPDISKANSKLGWEPVVDLEEGLRKTIEFFKGEG